MKYMEDNQYHSYMVAYDLRKPGRNYQELYEAIRSYEGWGKITESVWVVITTKDCVVIRDFLSKYIDANDRIMVLKTGDSAAWHNTIADNEWVKSNITR